MGCFRPLPPQAGHFERIKAMPSDLPFKSTGFATYPVPPQLGQSSGATPSPPRVTEDCRPDARGFRQRSFYVTNPEQTAQTRLGKPCSARTRVQGQDRSDKTVFTLPILSLAEGDRISESQLERAGQTCSLKILSIRIHFSPGFACGRAFWNLHIRFSHS